MYVCMLFSDISHLCIASLHPRPLLTMHQRSSTMFSFFVQAILDQEPQSKSAFHI